MVTGRLAPSPTGRLHLGHARTFLLAWWSIRAQGGRIVLRLEDLDGERASSTYVALAKRDLEWLGLDWDDEPRLQSDGLERIRDTALTLADRGRAYPCVCTRGDLRASVSAPQMGTTEIRYPGQCRGKFAGITAAEQITGRKAALRFQVNEGLVAVKDEFSGLHHFDVFHEAGDFPILRRDKIPSYQLAVVVDDAYDGVTEVVRGDDLLPSAARQILIAEALGFDVPRYYHVPLVVDGTGRRLAKRCDDLGISNLRDLGVDPRAIVEWVAQSAGFSEVTRVSPREYLSSFDWERIERSPVIFDEGRLHRLLTSR